MRYMPFPILARYLNLPTIRTPATGTSASPNAWAFPPARALQALAAIPLHFLENYLQERA